MAHSTRTQNGIGQKNNNSNEVKNTTGPTEGSKDSNNQHASLPSENPPHTPIFDHFLGEEILDKVLTWSLNTGEFVNALKLEQLKV